MEGKRTVKEQELHSEDNVGRVGPGSSVRPSCHSTPWTLNCAKHYSNTVIWTKNIGLSFLLPFFVNTVATFFNLAAHQNGRLPLSKCACAELLAVLCSRGYLGFSAVTRRLIKP